MHAPTPRRAMRACALIIAALLFSPVVSVQASGWPVVDALLNKTQFKASIEAVIQYGKQIQGMAKDAAHYKATYDKYQQELIKLKRMLTGLQMVGENAPQKRDLHWNVERCGGSGFSLAGVLRNVSLNPKGNILEQQRSICEWIQISENTKYNLTVKMISDVKSEATKALQAAAARRDTNNQNGTVDASDNDLLTVSAQMEAVYKNYSANMEAYDAQIAALKSAQTSLAEAALRGERGPLGTLVKTAALQGALKVGK